MKIVNLLNLPTHKDVTVLRQHLPRKSKSSEYIFTTNCTWHGLSPSSAQLKVPLSFPGTQFNSGNHPYWPFSGRAWVKKNIQFLYKQKILLPAFYRVRLISLDNFPSQIKKPTIKKWLSSQCCLIFYYTS